MADAMVISDWITVMNSFNLAQIGTPYEIYQKPDSRFDADFIGTMNLLSSVLAQVHQDRNVLSVRTEFSDRVLGKTTTNAAIAPGEKCMHPFVQRMWKYFQNRLKPGRTSSRVLLSIWVTWEASCSLP